MILLLGGAGQTQQPASSGFNFGGASATSTPAMGFNFSAGLNHHLFEIDLIKLQNIELKTYEVGVKQWSFKMGLAIIVSTQQKSLWAEL